jgi:hypothetical protein
MGVEIKKSLYPERNLYFKRNFRGNRNGPNLGLGNIFCLLLRGAGGALCFEIGPFSLAQAVLKVIMLQPQNPSARITGICQHTQLVDVYMVEL